MDEVMEYGRLARALALALSSGRDAGIELEERRRLDGPVDWQRDPTNPD